MQLEHKGVPIHANTAPGERCHVTILDFYMSKLPQEVKQKDFFYVRPLRMLPLTLQSLGLPLFLWGETS